jgi:hypothetical protein
MIEPRADRPRPITPGTDKAYDAKDFINELRSMAVTPQVEQNTTKRRPAIDGRTTSTPVTRSASAIARGSKRHSAGLRRSSASARPGSGAATAYLGASVWSYRFNGRFAAWLHARFLQLLRTYFWLELV